VIESLITLMKRNALLYIIYDIIYWSSARYWTRPDIENKRENNNR
jgi:hypothetical protein